MPVESGLGDPPDTEQLESLPPADGVRELHRLSEHAEPWWYASTPVDELGGGRFDLPAPDGTCYLAESVDGAMVEKLLRTGTKVVVRERLTELFHTLVSVRAPGPRTADLTSPAATGFGVNAEVHSTLDYRTTRTWASSIRKAGWSALRYLLRGDPSSVAAGRAFFGTTGLHRRAPTGMRTVTGILDAAEAERLLAARNVEVRPIPPHVPIQRP